ncbi:MAG: GNAT family N-acetyltransferase, partial [Armatimonadota bacterium]
GAPGATGVETREEEDGIEVSDLPYRSAPETEVTRRLVRCPSRTTRRWVARADGRVVGHVVGHRRPDRPSVVGIYDMGVVPDWRRRGVARALLATLLREARLTGAEVAVLNSAASTFYARLGFRDGGRGRTWWCHRPVFEGGLPDRAEVDRAEAIGFGNTEAIAAMWHRGRLPEDPNHPLPGGTGPVDLAVHHRRRAMVDWLESHGATVTATHAWTIGGPARVRALLRRHPDRIDRREGPFGATPLHRAVEDDDLDRVRFLVEHGADTHQRDARFSATPLGWARHLGRAAITAHLVAAGAPA